MTGYGLAEEVAEVASSLALDDESYAAKFLNKATDTGVRFTPEDVMDFLLFDDTQTLSRMAELSSEPFTRENLEDLEGIIPDDAFQRICNRAGIDIDADEEEDALEKDEDEFEDEEDDEFEEYIDEKPYKLGFFGTLAVILASFGATRHKQSDRCDGDCAHCPPHYGYRYGRWYYGHGHWYGCQRGGNRGGGGD